ncbi:hypothetical protein HNR65_002245 [Desulfosalsimonas propionicica]|uniref:Uncharacterized protein n=1 Tax=Desulfosalsimonas propionicica TaxID=332175 RepID=A0A7W0C9Z9_9BACT|nr:hypothetical protein [Desulfosalsimonas propionicica]MBA2881911.1 hypothetical protein [Desulfosalsimonas propionicica]
MVRKEAGQRIITLPVKEDPGNYERCPICGEPFQRKEAATVRQLWIDRCGFGPVPPEALVHPECDNKEQIRCFLKRPEPKRVLPATWSNTVSCSASFQTF